MSTRRSVLLFFGLVGIVLLGVWFRPSRTSLSAAKPPPAPTHEQTDRAPAPPQASSPEINLHSTVPLGAADAHDLHARLVRLLRRQDARLNEAVLTFVDADTYRQFLSRAQHRGLSVLAQLDGLLTVRVRYAELGDLEADLREFAADYADVAANHFFNLPQKPAKENRATGTEIPFRNSALSFLGVPADHANWGRGVRVAVLDSGVALDPTFGNGRLQFLDIGLGTLPGLGNSDGHGTSVASLVAGQDPDAPGAAPSATVVSIRVTDSTGRSDIFTVAQAILAAVDAGIPVINLSLGGYATSSALNAAIGYANAKGAIIVAAAGNDQATQLTWPAADPRVVSVGAVDARAQQVAFSNSGQQLQISAPGYGVQTAWTAGDRMYVDGTSASAPLVAGAIAAVMSQYPSLSAMEAWEVVRRTTTDAGAPGLDPNYGAGVLNLNWAMHFNDPTRLDPAISSHYYDAARNEMNFVVQNRSVATVRRLRLDVNTNGVTNAYGLPDIDGGANYVVRVPLSRSPRSASADVTFATELVTPIGLEDANVGNNRLSSRLPPPSTGPGSPQ